MAFVKLEQQRKTRLSVSSRAYRTGVRQEKLFCAAVRVALEQGFGHVTLTSVAKRAGVSKGGLLYHFSTKRALIEAMLHHYSHTKPRLNTGRCIDPLAATALIAAAENPALLAGLEDYLDVPASPQHISASSNTSGHLERMRSLINLLQLKRSANNTTSQAGLS